MKNPEYRDLYAISIYFAASLSGGKEYHCYLKHWMYEEHCGFVSVTTRSLTKAMTHKDLKYLKPMADKINNHLGYTAAVAVAV